LLVVEDIEDAADKVGDHRRNANQQQTMPFGESPFAAVAVYFLSLPGRG
jgi:hypothetical protein